MCSSDLSRTCRSCGPSPPKGSSWSTRGSPASAASSGPLFSTALVLAASTVVGPLAGALRSLVEIPLAIVLRGWLSRERTGGPPLLPTPAPDEAAPALMAVYTRPPWTVRLTWLAHLLYLPFLVLLGVELIM